MSVKAEKNAKRAVKVISGGISAAFLIAIICMVLLSLYALWDSHKVDDRASRAQYAAFLPGNDNPPVTFEQLQKINPEVTAWLNIYGTGIDYPVTQAKDNNQKYVNTDAFGDYDLSGSLFLDYRNSKNFSDFNSIIYGHHMASHLMFGDLGNFVDQQYFDVHQYGDLFYNNAHHGLEIFAVAHTDGYNVHIYTPGLQEETEQQQYLNYLQSISTHTRDIGVSTQDHILVMSTCNGDSTNGRDIVVARIVDKTFPNTLGSAPAQNSNGLVSAIDSLLAWWRQFPMGTLLVVWPFFILLLVAALLISNRRKKKRLADAEQSASGPPPLSDTSQPPNAPSHGARFEGAHDE